MGGGGDSRIPSILRELLPKDFCVVVNTYSFDPEIARCEIETWVNDYKPCLVIGESLGSYHAIQISQKHFLKCLLISPALNTDIYFKIFQYLAYIPGVRQILNKVYKPRVGDRQKLDFNPHILAKYKSHKDLTLSLLKANSSELQIEKSSNAGKRLKNIFAFFGENDHYRRSGVVSIRTYKKYFGTSYCTYPGTHFMEKEYIISILLPKIYEFL